MPTTLRTARLAATLSLTVIAPAISLADDPPAPFNPPALIFQRMADRIKPLPPFEIPDDPPPHEGAMIAMPYLVEPPDIIVVEVLEALPGRPISGERLVKPDGKIGLGFYGELDVTGLTTTQIKIKLIAHLQSTITDEVLGLTRYHRAEMPEEPEGDPDLPLVPGDRGSPFDLEHPSTRPKQDDKIRHSSLNTTTF